MILGIVAPSVNPWGGAPLTVLKKTEPLQTQNQTHAPHDVALWHTQEVVKLWLKLPEVCLGDNAVNQFLKQQCQQFWTRLGWATAVLALPWGVMFLFWGLMTSRVQGFYSDANELVRSGKVIAKGVVTNPPGANGGMFGWFRCLRAVTLQQQDSSQVRVYIPLSAPRPMPGQTFAILGRPGQTVQSIAHPVAVLHAPHLAVLGNGQTVKR